MLNRFVARAARKQVSRLSLSVLCLFFGASSLSSQQRAMTISGVPPVAEVNVTLVPQRRPHVVELRNFPDAAAPVMNLLDASNQQVARSIIKGRRASLSIPGATSGKFTLLIRSNASEGETNRAVQSGELWIDGYRMRAIPKFSRGQPIPLRAMSGREELIGISRSGGKSHSLYVTNANGDIIAREYGVRTKLPLAGGAIGRIFLGLTDDLATDIDIYWNDINRDADNDQMGDSLEAAVQTCGSRTTVVPGVNCATIADTRDTDGDGLRDSWEVLGYDAWWPDANGVIQTQYLPLPVWGSNPRHKDIFMELDFRRLTLADNQSNLSLMMPPQVALDLAAAYADDSTTDGALRAQHAASMGNPDGKPGISLHMDTGVAPLIPAHATIYGNWGGYTAVDAIPDSSGGYIPQTPGVWQQQMHPSRHGIFHYVLGYMTGGGQCGQGIACGFNMADLSNSSHEFGHTLGLDHNGPYGKHEPNCKPNYPSLMNYAYLGSPKFSDGDQTYPILNNHALSETAAINPSLRSLLRSLRSPSQWAHKVDTLTGSVDWNRDNKFAPAGTTVRAYGNYQPGGNGCEFTRELETDLKMMSQRTPAIVNYKNHLWVFSVTLDGKLAYTYTPQAYVCTNIDDCPQPSFYPPTVKDVGGVDAIDAAVINVNGRRMILIVGIRPDGTLFETWMEQSGGLFVWNGPNAIPASAAAGEPSLAVSTSGTSVVLAYRGTDNVVRYRSRSPAAFLAERTMNLGSTPLVMSNKGSPSVAFAYLPMGVVAGREHLVSAVIDSTRVLQLYTPREFGSGWQKLPVPYSYMGGAIGKPSMAWVGPNQTLTAASADSHTTGPITIGRFYIVYRKPDASVPISNPDAVRMAISYVDTNGTFRIGMNSFFDNVWSFAFGIDLMQPGEIKLRSATSYSIPNAPSHPNSLYMTTVRPHADGISNLPYRNYDDWKVIAWGSCATLNPHQKPAMKVFCAPKTW